MNKNVIALAVAAAMAAPLAAQAEVKISGGLQAQLVNVSGDLTSPNGWYATDGGQVSTDAKTTTTTTNNTYVDSNGDIVTIPTTTTTTDKAAKNGENSGNYGFLKFAASEDLGNGMKALAVYNMNISVGDADGVGGNGGPGGREAFIGLSGGFGTVLAGTLSNPYKSATVKWDPFLATFAQARGNFGASGLHNSYLGNALAYANKFGMAKVVAAIVLDETDNSASQTDKTTAQHAKALSVNMPVGPVEVALGYVDMTNFAGGADSATALKIGVKYTAGAITVSAQNENLDKGLGDMSYTLLNGSYAMGANTISMGYGVNTPAKGDDLTYTAVGVKHAFSKKVSANVAYRVSDNGTDSESVFGAGMRVAF